MKWAYGVTTVPERRNTLLPVTLYSLTQAGFPQPRLFVDGDRDIGPWIDEFQLSVTGHYPPIRTLGNWILGLWELTIRYPSADYYAMFQDDILLSRNVRQYIEESNFPNRGYVHLFASPVNEQLHTFGNKGYYPTNQMGKGALALVFTRDVLCELFTAPGFFQRPLHPNKGHRNVDGIVSDSLRPKKILEYTHYPSLVQHNGKESTIDKNPTALSEHPAETFVRFQWPDSTFSTTFLGVEFDAMSLLQPTPS